MRRSTLPIVPRTLISIHQLVVTYPSVVLADPGGSEPSGYGSSSSEGEQCAENEWQEKRFDLRFEFAGESFGDGLEEFESGVLSLQNHGSSF